MPYSIFVCTGRMTSFFWLFRLFCSKPVRILLPGEENNQNGNPSTIFRNENSSQTNAFSHLSFILVPRGSTLSMLNKLGPARGLDSWCWVKGSWPLGTRMAFIPIIRIPDWFKTDAPKVYLRCFVYPSLQKIIKTFKLARTFKLNLHTCFQIQSWIHFWKVFRNGC